MAFTRITISQDFTLADGFEPTGTVTFTPTAPMINGSVAVPAAPVVAKLNNLGTIGITLDANTDPGTTPANTSYRVDEEINKIRRSYVIQIPYNEGDLILYTLAQLASPPNLSFPVRSDYTAVSVDGVFQATFDASGIADSQPLDADLTAIAALTANNDDFLQRKAGAWTNRTVAQVKTDLGLGGSTGLPAVVAVLVLGA